MQTSIQTEILNQEKLLEEDSVVQMRKKLKLMKGVKASKKSISWAILKIIPFFNKFIASAEGVGNAITNLVKIEGCVTKAANVAGTAFNAIHLFSAIIDFFRIPCIYIGSMIAGQKCPITLSRNARFLYSAVLLGLTITALAFPPSAPIIALVTAIITLGVSVVTFAKLVYKRYQIQDQLKNIENNIEIKRKEITALINSLEYLEDVAKIERDKNQPKFELLGKEIKIKREEIKNQLNTLQELYNNQVHCKQKLEKLGLIATVDKTMGVFLASLGLIGVIVGLFFPPAGMAILVVAASLGFTYLIGRIAYPLIVTKKAKQSETELQDDKEGLNDDLQNASDCNVKFKIDMLKETKRLEETTAGYRIVDESIQPEETTQSQVSKSTMFKPTIKNNQNADKEDDEEGEHIDMSAS